jgi:hypothetical protein
VAAALGVHSVEGVVVRWNFIGRSRQGIEQGRKDWMEGTRFGEVHGYGGAPLPVPEVPPLSRGRVR